jgi:GntR family transcriptional regulator/MocR family aminotransferase
MEFSPKNLKVIDGAGPKYLRLARAIVEMIKSGSLGPGTWLPSSRELSEQIGIHRHTVTAALDELCKEGWLVVVERKGFQVASALSEMGSQPAPFRFDIVHRISFGDFVSPGPITYNFLSGVPDLKEFPIEEYRACINEGVREGDLARLGYGSPLGYEPLREALAVYLKRVRGIEGRSIVVTHGSQEGLYLTAHLLVSPGDYVAIEDPGYPPVREAFKAMGAKIALLQVDEEGVVPDHFESQIKRFRPKLVYLTPTHQFPTTGSMSASRKQQILTLAQQHGTVIFEDDYDHEFHYISAPPSPLASLDYSGQVLYSSTFSKLMFPGSRLAFMAVPSQFAHELAQWRRITTHQNEILSQDALYRWIVNEGIYTHLRRMKKLYQARRDVMVDALTRFGGQQVSWKSPDGGMALWLDVQGDADLVAARALKNQIFVTAESYYRHRKGIYSGIRLGFSSLTEREIVEGIENLAKHF